MTTFISICINPKYSDTSTPYQTPEIKQIKLNYLLMYLRNCRIFIKLCRLWSDATSAASDLDLHRLLFVCVEVLWPSQPNGGHVERGQFT